MALAFLVLLVSREVSGYSPGITGLDYIAELFFSNNYHVYFPVVPWISFILFGMFFGMLLRDNDYRVQSLYAPLLPTGIIAIITGAGLCYYNFDYHFGNFFHTGPGGVIYMLGINLILLWTIHKLLEGDRENMLSRFLLFCSQRVTSMYVIQWIIICWGMGIFGYQSLNAWQTLALMPLMLALTIAVQLIKDKLFLFIKKPSSRSEESIATPKPQAGT